MNLPETKLPYDWVIEGALARGYVTELTGPERDGFVTRCLADAAAGQDCGWRKVPKAVKSIIVTPKHLSMVSHIIASCEATGIDLREIVHQIDGANTLAREDQMLKEVVKYGHGLVIIHDTPGYEHINWRRFAQDADCAVLLSHDGKPDCDARFVARLVAMTRPEAKRLGFDLGDVPKYVRLDVKERND